MLHLAIIGIACAVSALNEGIAFIERKNNEFNTFCLSEEGKQNITKASLPRVYDVEVHNFSDCGENRIANRTNSFFYDYIINRYHSGRHNSCNFMEKVSLKEMKYVESEADFVFKKRKLLWEKRKSTLRHSVKNERSQNKEHKLKLKKCKKREPKSEQLKKNVYHSDLSHREKKLFLKLKNLKNSLSGPFSKDNNLDAEARIEKFFKKMEQENQLEEDKTLQADIAISRRKFEGFQKTHPKSSVYNNNNNNNNNNNDNNNDNNNNNNNNNLRDVFSLRKNSFRNKHHIVNSNSDLFSVNPAVGKSGYISVGDTPKTVLKTLPNFQTRMNYPYFYSDIRDLRPRYNKVFFNKPYPYSASFQSKLNFLYYKPKFVSDEKCTENYKNRLRLDKSKQRMKHWPIFKNITWPRSHEAKQKLTFNENNNEPSSFHSGVFREKKTTKENGESKDVIIELAPVLKTIQKHEEDLPSHTIEKPFFHGYPSQMQESTHKIPGDYYDSMTDFPLFNSTYNHFCQKYSDQTSGSFPFSHYIKVRHALRKCLIHRILKNRNKRCGMSLCSAPRKCWRSAPLLCIPYIKKGQDDILKYLIRIMEKMLGKPCPPKADIFEQTKYKPNKKLINENGCDDSCDDYETESTTAPLQISSYPANDSTKSLNESSTKPSHGLHITSSTKSSISSTTVPTFASNMKPTFESSIASSIGLVSLPNNEPVIRSSVGLNKKARLGTSVMPNNKPNICKISETKQQIQRKNCSVGSFNCTPAPNFPIDSNIANSHFDDPAHFVIPLPMNNTWLKTAPSLGEITTKNLNEVSDQPLLSPSSISSTTEPTSSFSLNDLASSSNEIEDYMNKITNNAHSSATLQSTKSFIPEVTESSEYEPCFSTINPDSQNFSNFSVKDADCFSISPQSDITTTKYSNTQPYQGSELDTSIPSYNAQPEYSNIKPPFLDLPFFNLLNDYSKVQPYQNFKIPGSEPLDQNIKIPNPPQKPQSNNFDLHNEDFGNLSSIIQDIPKPVSETTESSLNEFSTSETSSLKHNKSKIKEKGHKHSSRKYSKNKKEHSKRYLSDNHRLFNPESNFFFPKKKKHQKKLFKENLRSPKKELNNLFDSNFYDAYPPQNSIRNNKKSHKKHSKRARKNHFHKKKHLKMKNSEKQNSLARRKREDDYSWPEIYSNYQDESLYEEKNNERLSENSTTTSDSNPPDQEWTPPFYDMFNELAKAVSGSTSTESEKEKITTSEHSNIATTIKANATDATTIITTPSATLVTTTAKPTTTTTGIKATSANTLTSDTSAASMTASTIAFTKSANATLPKATTITTSNKAAADNITNFSGNSSAKTNSFIGVRLSTTAAKNNSNATIIPKTTAPPTYKRIIIQTNTSHFIGGTGAVVDGFDFIAANAVNKAIFNTSATNNTAIKTTENTPTAITFNTNNEVYKSKNFAVASENHKTAIQNEKIVSENEKSLTKNVRSNLSLPHNDRKNFTLTANSSHPLKIRVDSIIGSKYGGKLLKGKGMDIVKTGKKSFFQTNFKGNSSNSESSAEKNSKKDSGKEEKTGKGSQDSDSGDGQAPTTLKAAVIVKGSKKMLTKPSPKVFSRIYPDSFNFEIEANDTVTTTMTTPNSSIENKTALLSSTLKPDIRLQLLAVCEGYLEIIKRIKVLNQTFGEKTDADLARYCESIISQSFNPQSEKPKKSESSESSLKSNYVNAVEEIENNKEFSDSHIQEKSPSEIIIHSASEKKNENNETKKKSENLNEGKNVTEVDSSENSELKKKKNKIKRRKICKKGLKSKQVDQKNDQREEGSLKRGITEEQVKIIELLKKRKRALMSWLINSKDHPDDLPETEYFDDEDFIPPDSEFSEYSGTIKLKRNDNIFKRTTPSLYYSNKAFPIYAKHYGYDKDGELREIEVLWREVNEKTHEQKILKNISVIAFLMTSTSSPNLYQEETKSLGAKEYEDNLVDAELKKKSNKVGFASEMSDVIDKTTTSETDNLEIKAVRDSESTTVTPKPSKKNETHIFISKPDPSLIVGTPPNKNKTHQNTTRKVSHKYDVAKDFVQEYSIEFLNYAVYILPAMFTILFFFCCFGCALYILKTRKSFKKGKKKKKINFTSDETTETSEDFEDSRAKRKRDNKRKKKAYKSDGEDANSEKKTKKKFWNVLKMPTSSSKELNQDNTQNERKSFLKFLKGRKEDNKAENNKFSKNYPDSDQSDQYVATSTEEKKDANSEAVERRELISLLEELKKIELEQTGEKKEVKSVQVQYAIQEDENPFYKRPEFSYPYEKNVFGFPKGYFFCNKKFPGQSADKPFFKGWDINGDVSEMTELLPCPCNYYPDKKDYFRHFNLNQEGECKHLYKIYKDSGVNKKPFEDKNFMNNHGEKNKSYIYNKQRSMNSDSSDELLGVNKKNMETEVRLTENSSPFRLLLNKNTGLIEKMENVKHHLNKKKYVRLKDDGVLCRL